MQLGDYNSGKAATTNSPSFLAAQDYEDALLERLANVEDEIPRASNRASKHAKLLFQTIRVEIQLVHSAPLPNQQHLVLTLAPADAMCVSNSLDVTALPDSLSLCAAPSDFMGHPRDFYTKS